jgi:hypothetical protein
MYDVTFRHVYPSITSHVRVDARGPVTAWLEAWVIYTRQHGQTPDQAGAECVSVREVA